MNNYHTVLVHVNTKALQELLADQDDTIPDPNIDVMVGENS